MNDYGNFMTFTMPMDENDLRCQKTFSPDNDYHLSSLAKAKNPRGNDYDGMFCHRPMPSLHRGWYDAA
jgi:hypothetical protein